MRMSPALKLKPECKVKEHNKMKLIKRLIFSGEKPVIRNIVSLALYVISLLMLDIALRTMYVSEDTSFVSGAVPFLFSFFWAILFGSISFLLPRLARRIFVIATTTVYAIITLVHEFFYSFFGNYMSFSSITFAGDGADFFDWSYFNISKKLILVLIFSVFLSVISALILPKMKYKLIPTIAAALVFVLSIVGINVVKAVNINDDGGITWDSAQSNAEIYDDFTDQFTCMHMAGLYQYTFRDFMISTGLEDVVMKLSSASTMSELDEYYASKEIDPDNEMTGIFKDKNLILIQLEAIDSWMLNDIAMPNLSAIREKSIDFENYYAPKYLWAATFNSENVVNTGMISPMNSSRTSYFDENYYPYSMAHLFTDAGYDTNSYHRSGGGVYNRGNVHINWGYKTYNSGGALGLSDLDLDTALIEAYDKIVKDDKFMSLIITYSGHGPYSSETKEVKAYYDIIRPQLPDDVEEEYAYVLCHAYETDLFIGKLMEKLEEDGHIDDTVVIFYTDHYDHYVTDTNILTKYKGTSDMNLMCNVPFMIYAKDIEPMKVKKAVASYDILPTVVNLFDLNTDGRYYVGNDAFSDNGGYIIFSDRSWYDGETYFNVYESTPTELSVERKEEISKRLEMCWNSIKLDYFRKIAD